MATSASQNSTVNVKKSKRVLAMTLVEVLVALAVVSFVFSSLTQMTFDSLKRAKKLELQDKMRNYASEAVQVIMNAKNVNWQEDGGFTKVLPPASDTAPTQAYVTYESGSRLLALPTADCTYDKDSETMVGGDCSKVIPPESSERNLIFGRIIQRVDKVENNGSGLDSVKNEAEVSIIIACIDGVCDPKDFPPFVITFKVFRTGAAQ